MMNGLLLLNKDLNISSNRAMQAVKRLYGADKIGHTGSLDPLATGMLPLCFGEATKFAQYLLNADKSYEVTGLLGVQTTTGDAEGDVLATHDVPDISPEDMEHVLQDFRGEIWQKPPMFSALKHEGVPLYIYALKGIEIDKPARLVKIHDLSLLGMEHHHFRMRVTCSKGTYIRRLVEDIGERFGCGAHVTQLHRSTTAGFSAADMRTYAELLDMDEPLRLSRLLPIDVMLMEFPSHHLSQEEAYRIQNGQILAVHDLPAAFYRLYNQDQAFIGLGEYRPQQGLMAKRMCRPS
ncbi:MAG: tRNA pseudouridine(55) synthase TruB [Gammaproteobacteria bacterium]|nr:tRNA pseudouridine(55) synthase TruB [Gammaproteobacteria bacterium]